MSIGFLCIALAQFCLILALFFHTKWLTRIEVDITHILDTIGKESHKIHLCENKLIGFEQTLDRSIAKLERDKK